MERSLTSTRAGLMVAGESWTLMSRLRNVGLLAAGTAAAQVVNLAAAPLLTRLYTPAEFGLLAVFSSVASIASVTASLRLELAVPVPPDDEEAIEVVSAGFLAAIVISALSVGAVLVLGGWFASAVGEPGVRSLLWLLPVYLVASGLYHVLNYWFTRRDGFATVAAVNAVRAILTVVSQYLLGVARLGALGLVAGQTLSPVVQALGLLLAAPKVTGRMPFRRLSWRRFRAVLSRFRNYVVFGTPQALVNALNQSLPAIVMTIAFSPSVAGFYLMAHRLVAAPISVL